MFKSASLGDRQNHKQTDGDWRGQETKRPEDFSTTQDAKGLRELKGKVDVTVSKRNTDKDSGS